MAVREQERSMSYGDLTLDATDVLADYDIAYRSRQASLVGRREVMSGKAKFGIFGDGKEVPQVAMARAWRNGDFRAGYYRDQTLLLALGMTSYSEFFAQLYAHADIDAEPATGGRQMNCHFGTRSLDDAGRWKDLTAQYNTSTDLSPTGSQMPRLVGLAHASRLYRDLPELEAASAGFSRGGHEVAWGMIGNATCAEGVFWEAVNAVGVLGAPMVLSIWDDGYGISVPNEMQIARADLADLLAGFQREADGPGLEIRSVPGWDYPAMLEAYEEAAALARREHVPTVLHVTELTQPQGHSTSGSHERYKSEERLAWEEEWDCVAQMRAWIEAEGLATAEDLDARETVAREEIESERVAAWEAYTTPLEAERDEVATLISGLVDLDGTAKGAELRRAADALRDTDVPLRKHVFAAAQRALQLTAGQGGPARDALTRWYASGLATNEERYGRFLYSESDAAAARVKAVAPAYGDAPDEVMGFEVVNAGFDAMMARDPRVIAFGEDLGRIGDVNQGFRGLQDKYGPLRVSDTGIREATILGQAIGLAMRGLRPIAEMQYLDYLLYALQIMSDDLATLHWRSAGGQKAPVIVRTRGHRLEGVWHSGSPMAGIISLVRGMHVLVPRDMTRAVGFYNTLLAGDEPGLVVEVLNGYRVREPMPDNIGDLRVPVGVPEVLRSGSDLTIVTYGATCRIVLAAADRLEESGIDAEVIDVQSLLPFDRTGTVGASLRKTGRIVFVDEDVPGGATAYMLRQVVEGQGGYAWLDAEPRTLPGTAHRPAYGTDGDYFSKPNVEDVFAVAYDIMNEVDPAMYPELVPPV